MKFQLGIVVLISLLCLNCTTDDDNNNDNSNAQEQIEQAQNVAQTGSWQITNFNDSGQDETSDFTGYSFLFNVDGMLTASNEATTQTGTWSISESSNSSSSDDSNDDLDDVDFNIFIQVSDSSDFEDLNDDWDIVSITTSRIELRDVSGGDGSLDILVFEKI